jgi:hypothetical protein
MKSLLAASFCFALLAGCGTGVADEAMEPAPAEAAADDGAEMGTVSAALGDWGDNDALTFYFRKDCPETSCTGYLTDRYGNQIPGSSASAELTPAKFENNLLQFTQVVKVSKGTSAFTIIAGGVLNYAVTPTQSSNGGFVLSGTWSGKNLANAEVILRSKRVTGSIFRGSIVVTPR